MKKLQIFKYEYEMEKSVWRVSIAAFSPEEALDFLMKSVNGNIRIVSSTHLATIDIFTDKASKELLKFLTPDKKPVGRPPKEVVKNVAPKKVLPKA